MPEELAQYGGTDQAAPFLMALNSATPMEFSKLLSGAVEHAPWVVAGAIAFRPFFSLQAIAEAFAKVIRQSPRNQQLQTICNHPELAGREALVGEMTPESTSEQGRLGLMSLNNDQFDRLQTLNSAYRSRFGFPFVTALRRHADLTSVFRDGEARLLHDLDTEILVAISEIASVSEGRIERLCEAFLKRQRDNVEH